MAVIESRGLTENDWEQMALDTLGELGWKHAGGTEIAPGTGERASWDELLIVPRLKQAIARFNPNLPEHVVDQAVAEIATARSTDAIAENEVIHGFLTEGLRKISYIDDAGEEITPTIRLLSPDPDENDWLAVDQVTIVKGDHRRRFDVVLYLNGMPVSIVELKKAGAESAGLVQAHAQLRTYLKEFPLAFRFVVFNLISDGITARYGTPFTPFNHFSPWNVDDYGAPVTNENLDGATPLDTALFGLFNQERFLQLLRNFTAFDHDENGLLKRIAKPHQYFAVTKAVGSTVQAVGTSGKAGVVWHTQGSGKSMEMELYANQVIRHPQLANPTIVVITDRTELDGQLYETFLRSRLLPEQPKQIRRREELRQELSGRTTGGIYFTTLQKFGRTVDERHSGASHPLLTERRNVIVMVDEAHRSHYDNLDGYARHLRDALPHATLIAFTGTPISKADRNTRDVFGDYIDIYDLTRAVDDGATVPVYFESRLVKVSFAEDVSEQDLDASADEVTLGLDDTERDRIEKSVAVINAVYGAPTRLKKLAADLVEHWEARRAAMTPFVNSAENPAAAGKAMIVGATREICANLYREIVTLRPDWHTDDLSTGRIKVVYSGGPTDEPPISDHVRRDSENAAIKKRIKDIDDELELVIVKDMMLTGFDAPPLHTMYLDRPLQGALLMQALARVNRTFRGKEDGLLVAYAPVADNLAQALAEYTASDRERKPIGKDIGAAIDTAKDLIRILENILHGFDWREQLQKPGPRAYFDAANATVNYLRDPRHPENQVGDGQESLAARFRKFASQLSRTWAICGSHEALRELAPVAQFFEEVRVYMAKWDAEERYARGQAVPEDVQRALRQLMAASVESGEVLDIYDAAGMPKPSLKDINVDFIRRTQEAKNPNLAIEALRKLITDESRKAAKHNVIRQRAFSERLQALMIKYTNSQLTSAEVIAALVEMAKEVAAESDRGSRFTPPLDENELAFYDAVAQNESAVEEQGEGKLADIARDLVAVMRRDASTDWTVREDVKARLRSQIKRLLTRHGYPPDRQPAAIKLVIEQMEIIAPSMAA
ncbi:DEAD/DEAH box helicase [Prescottella equi]|uniref:type I restriction endonuclease subunit R n=1 Tax=Rhodococcus hoagii TaxID=43767 RepID=UPI0019F092BD|nr:type I restriction endonuclease subunit R [Prescottella equi]MBM4639789.1 HsdR family type I site-specific deoxyribonuclease [Prescottella equi]MBM4669663.1 HsdR family type I site-specific deoxyribonuclease [Prescottella equi]NKV87255.1 HsdR family type I site-specific deoxyribonuclease [Prescottella equi]BCN62846.1 DEAD/DEAH box helicase [Prescottella equi]BCN72699.1 DEAD/DEAH box helicase [Prescottella equi]